MHSKDVVDQKSWGFKDHLSMHQVV